MSTGLFSSWLALVSHGLDPLSRRGTMAQTGRSAVAGCDASLTDTDVELGPEVRDDLLVNLDQVGDVVTVAFVDLTGLVQRQLEIKSREYHVTRLVLEDHVTRLVLEQLEIYL